MVLFGDIIGKRGPNSFFALTLEWCTVSQQKELFFVVSHHLRGSVRS